MCATVPHNSSLRTSIVAMLRKSRIKPYPTNVLDYPCTMSGFERESLAAEAMLKVKVVLTIRCPKVPLANRLGLDRRGVLSRLTCHLGVLNVQRVDQNT